MVHGMGSGPGDSRQERDVRRGSDDSGQSVGHVKDQVQHQAGQVADQVQHYAGELTHQARDQGMSWASGQKDRLCESMDSLTQALRQTAQQLEKSDQAGLANFMEMATEQVDQVSRFVRERDVDQLMGETERMARRNPGLFVGGAFALGLIAARFLKSSTPDTGDEYGYGNQMSQGTYGGSYGRGYGGTMAGERIGPSMPSGGQTGSGMPGGYATPAGGTGVGQSGGSTASPQRDELRWKAEDSPRARPGGTQSSSPGTDSGNVR